MEALNNDELQTLIMSFLYLEGASSQADILSFLARCDNEVKRGGPKAARIKDAASGKVYVTWSKQDQDFAFEEMLFEPEPIEDD